MRFRFILILAALFLSGCSNMLFVPVKPFPVTPDEADIAYEDRFIETADGTLLHGWKLHADTARSGGKKLGNILFFHGNGDNISTQ
jgi:hypothetical protein